jgi:hypothetical protein
MGMTTSTTTTMTTCQFASSAGVDLGTAPWRGASSAGRGEPMMTLHALSFSAAELRALCAHACTDPVHPQVHAVHFEPRRGRAWATDRHRIAVRYVGGADATGKAPASYTGPDVVSMPLADVEALARSVRALGVGARAVLALDGASFVPTPHVGYPGEAHPVRWVPEWVPPPIDSVIPKGRTRPHASVAHAFSFAPLYLGDLAAVDIAMRGDVAPRTCVTAKARKAWRKQQAGVCGFMWSPETPLAPMVYEGSHGAEPWVTWVVVVMPRRDLTVESIEETRQLALRKAAVGRRGGSAIEPRGTPEK